MCGVNYDMTLLQSSLLAQPVLLDILFICHLPACMSLSFICRYSCNCIRFVHFSLSRESDSRAWQSTLTFKQYQQTVVYGVETSDDTLESHSYNYSIE